MSSKRWVLAMGLIVFTSTLPARGGESKIVFHAERSGNVDIYTRDENGDPLSEEQLTTDEANDEYPIFCGGSKVVWTSDRAGSDDLWIMDADDGYNKVNLTKLMFPGDLSSREHEAHCRYWTVSGNMDIIFRRTPQVAPIAWGQDEIYKITIDSSGSVISGPDQLTSNTVMDENPQWCGSQIIFARNERNVAPCNGDSSNPDRVTNPGIDYQLWIMDADGSNPRQLTSTPYTHPYNGPPSCNGCCPANPTGQAAFYWPTCKWDDTAGVYNIAFSAALAANYADRGIFRMPLCSTALCSNTEGEGCICNVGDATALTTDPSLSDYPAWSPGGEDVVFASDRAGNLEIFKMNSADGEAGSLERLTTNTGDDVDPHAAEIGSK